MVDVRLKKTISDIVDKQLLLKCPPFVDEIYNKLLEKGYSAFEAKNKIGVVVLAEIVDFIKNGEFFNEEKYQNDLVEMFQQIKEFNEIDYSLELDWMRWDALIQEGYMHYANGNEEKCLTLWDKAWIVFQTIMEQENEKCSLGEFMAKLDNQYPVDDWLQDFENVLTNVKGQETRVIFCIKLSKMFSRNDYMVSTEKFHSCNDCFR